MNDIPEVVEQLYYNWGTIPDPENWSEYIGKIPCSHRAFIPSTRACAWA